MNFGADRPGFMSQHLDILDMGLWADPAIFGCVVVFEL